MPRFASSVSEKGKTLEEKYLAVSDRGEPSGSIPLDTEGKVPEAYLPETSPGEGAGEAEGSPFEVAWFTPSPSSQTIFRLAGPVKSVLAVIGDGELFVYGNTYGKRYSVEGDIVTIGKTVSKLCVMYVPAMPGPELILESQVTPAGVMGNMVSDGTYLWGWSGKVLTRVRISDGSSTSVTVPSTITHILPHGDYVYFQSYDYAPNYYSQVSGGKVHRDYMTYTANTILYDYYRPEKLIEVNGKVWGFFNSPATGHAYIAVYDSTEKIALGYNSFIHRVYDYGDYIWVATSNNLYRVHKTTKAVSSKPFTDPLLYFSFKGNYVIVTKTNTSHVLNPVAHLLEVNGNLSASTDIDLFEGQVFTYPESGESWCLVPGRSEVFQVNIDTLEVRILPRPASFYLSFPMILQAGGWFATFRELSVFLHPESKRKQYLSYNLEASAGEVVWSMGRDTASGNLVVYRIDLSTGEPLVSSIVLTGLGSYPCGVAVDENTAWFYEGSGKKLCRVTVSS